MRLKSAWDDHFSRPVLESVSRRGDRLPVRQARPPGTAGRCRGGTSTYLPHVNVPFSHPSGGRAQKDGRKVRWCCQGTFTLGRSPRPATSARHGVHPVRHAGRALQRHDAGRAPCARPPVEIDIFVRGRRCHRLPRTKMSISTPEGASARPDRHGPARDTAQRTSPADRLSSTGKARQSRGAQAVPMGQHVELDREARQPRGRRPPPARNHSGLPGRARSGPARRPAPLFPGGLVHHGLDLAGEVGRSVPPVEGPPCGGHGANVSEPAVLAVAVQPRAS